jgi:hypothetical protein
VPAGMHHFRSQPVQSVDLARNSVNGNVSRMRFAIQRGGNTHGFLDLFSREARVAQGSLMAVNATAAAVDGGHREAPKLKVRLIHAWLAAWYKRSQ